MCQTTETTYFDKSLSSVWPEEGSLKFLFIIFEKSLLSGEVPANWKKGNITLIYKKGSKEEPGNYQLANLMSVPMKITEQILLEGIFRQMRNKEVI